VTDIAKLQRSYTTYENFEQTDTVRITSVVATTTLIRCRPMRAAQQRKCQLGANVHFAAVQCCNTLLLLRTLTHIRLTGELQMLMAIAGAAPTLDVAKWLRTEKVSCCHCCAFRR
jgi:hypothetical protein